MGSHQDLIEEKMASDLARNGKAFPVDFWNGSQKKKNEIIWFTAEGHSLCLEFDRRNHNGIMGKVEMNEDGAQGFNKWG